MNNDILTKEEISTFESMSLYWDEVSERDDISPLRHEAFVVYNKLGIRLLDLVKYYINFEKMNKGEKI